MSTLITVIHVFSCIFLVLVVLLQTGKGAEMGAVFGGSSSTVFGSSGAGNFLTRLTTGVAIVFMLTSLSLTYMSSRHTASTVFDSAPLAEPGSEGAPAPGGEPGMPAPGGEPAAAEPQAAAPGPEAAAAKPVEAAPAAPAAEAPPAPEAAAPAAPEAPAAQQQQ